MLELLLEWCEKKILLAGWRPLEQNRVVSRETDRSAILQIDLSLMQHLQALKQ